MQSELQVNFGLKVTRRAKLLLRWYGLKHRLGFRVDSGKAAEKLASACRVVMEEVR